MKKTPTPLTAVLLLFPILLFSQTTWYQIMPFASAVPTFYGMAAEGDGYVVFSDRNIFQTDRLGNNTGRVTNQTAMPFTTGVIKRYDQTTGDPYFIMARRNITPSTQYILTEHRPGIGFVNSFTITDTLGSLSGLRPSMLEQADGSIIVVGKQHYRKVTYDPVAGFTELWVRPFNITATSVLQQNDTIIACDANGLVVALDEDGNTLWTQNHGINLRSIAAAPGGYIGCGQFAGNQAVIIRMDAFGAEIWREETSDQDYYDVVSTDDGSFATTGLAASGNIVLAHFGSDGAVLWQKTYGTGTGIHLLQDADGGFVLMARATNPISIHMIKTDADGQTASPKKAVFQERQLQTESLEATLYAWPTLFFDGSKATLISRADSAATIFDFSPWIGGLRSNGDVHLTASRASGGGFNFDYESGPLNGQPEDFTRVWLANRQDINTLRYDFGVDESLDGPVPFDLLTWPGRGNPNFKYNLDFTRVTTDPNLFSAPFVDVNNDGMYNVYDGDYPLIKGDNMVWMVFNDDVAHDLSSAMPLNMELQVSVYAFDCAESDAIDQSLFASFEFINRSTNDYLDTYMGFFTDFDLGCLSDDYVGTLPEENTNFVYNASALETNCPNGEQGFGSNIPVQSISYLNKEMHHSLPNYTFNAPPGTSGPTTAQEYYNCISGKWRDGTPLTSGGTGYNPGSTDFVNHAFPGNPSDPQGWSMCTTVVPPTDMRTVTSHGPFEFEAGDTFQISVAFTFHPNIEHPCPDIFGAVKPTVAQMQTWQSDGALDAQLDLGQVATLISGQSITLDAGLPGGTNYSWSTGASTPSITVTQPGAYAVTATSATGCQWEDNVLVQLSTGLTPVVTPAAWSIHPNPAGAYATITCANGAPESASVVVRNSQGSVVRRLEAAAGPQIRLETTGWSAGMYWIELWDGTRSLGVKKLMVGR